MADPLDVTETALDHLQGGDWVLTSIATGRTAQDISRRLPEIVRHELGLDGAADDAVILVGRRRT